MKKEVILAITIGFVLGLVITFGIWVANRSLKQTSNAMVTPTPTLQPASLGTSPVPTNQVTNNQLTISTPDDESITALDKITVTGKTIASSVVAILYEDGQTFVTAGDDGKFSIEVPLVGGYNEITATSEDYSQTITVTYSTAKI